MKKTLLVVALVLPSLSLAGQKSFQIPVVPPLSLPGVAGNILPLALPGAMNLPVLTPGQIEGVYRLPGVQLPNATIKLPPAIETPHPLRSIKFPPRRRGLPGEDDEMYPGVTADLVPPKRPRAPAAFALALPIEDAVSVAEITDEAFVVRMEHLFDRSRELEPALAH